MAESDIGAPLLSGDDWMMRVFFNSERFGEDLIVSADVKANTTKYRDDHAGNKSSKVDVRVWGWDISVKFHYKTDRMIQALMKFYAAKRTAGVVPVTMSILLAIQQRDAAALRPGYLFSPVVADYNLSLPGMKERLTQSLDCWAENWTPYQVSG
jgi:hypothetical protein